MINKLKLEGNELIIYALIYGFTQDGKSEFTGSKKYMAEWCNIDRRSAIRVVERLIKKGLITKRIDTTKKGESVAYYKAVIPSDKMSLPSDKKTPLPSDKMSPNNNKYITNNKKGTFNDFEQRVYNFSELEKILRSN